MYFILYTCHFEGQQPTDPSIGFLPPNPENGTEGQGYVTFSVRPKRDTPDLAVIDAEARIIFDQNDPIDTPPIFNTVTIAVFILFRKF